MGCCGLLWEGVISFVGVLTRSEADLEAVTKGSEGEAVLWGVSGGFLHCGGLWGGLWGVRRA